MDDKEMLHQAAKAAGVEVIAYDWQFGCRVIDDGLRKDWNPIDDDGDALRLAVKLGMHFINIDIQSSGWVSISMSAGMEDVVEAYRDDPCAATRRAIVRAAAEIGRRVP